MGGFVAAESAIRDRLGEIGCPTLIVGGEMDRLVPLRDAAQSAWLISDARKIVCSDTGHLEILARPARLPADLRALLDEAVPERAGRRRSGRRSPSR